MTTSMPLKPQAEQGNQTVQDEPDGQQEHADILCESFHVSILSDQIGSCNRFTLYHMTPFQQGGLALIRAGNPGRYLFMGPPVFCRNYPSGKPANNSPGTEPQNEFNQFHINTPFSVFHNHGLAEHRQVDNFIDLPILGLPKRMPAWFK